MCNSSSGLFKTAALWIIIEQPQKQYLEFVNKTDDFTEFIQQ